MGLDVIIHQADLRVEDRSGVLSGEVNGRLLYRLVNHRRVVVDDELAVILLPFGQVAQRELALVDGFVQFLVGDCVLLLVDLVMQKGGELRAGSVDEGVELIQHRLLAGHGL